MIPPDNGNPAIELPFRTAGINISDTDSDGRVLPQDQRNKDICPIFENFEGEEQPDDDPIQAEQLRLALLRRGDELIPAVAPNPVNPVGPVNPVNP